MQKERESPTGIEPATCRNHSKGEKIRVKETEVCRSTAELKTLLFHDHFTLALYTYDTLIKFWPDPVSFSLSSTLAYIHISDSRHRDWSILELYSETQCERMHVYTDTRATAT